MTTSSQQTDYSTISLDNLDTITLTSSDYISNTSATTGTITIASDGYTYPTYTTAGSSYTISTAGINGISSIDLSGITTTLEGLRVSLPEEWVDSFPDFDRVSKMCEKYPGLKIAYEKFVTTYKLVKDDYDNPENKK